MSVNEENDVHADIRAALEAQTASDQVVNVVDPANEEPVELPEEPKEEASEGPKRGTDGKFVAKTEETEQVQPEQPEAKETPQESIRPPASWSAAAKSKFAALDPDVQKEVLRREQEVDKGFRERAEQLKRYEPLEQVIAPHRQKWAVAGVDEATAIKQLLAASEWLERDPAQAIAYLAKQYGLGSAQPTEGQVQAPQPAGNSQQESALLQRIAQLEQSVQQATQAPLVSQIEAFKNDPANLYFENVRDDMAVLLSSGKANDLKEAYEMACWMRPDIRPFLQTVQAPAPVVDRQKTERAKAAGVSVTGAPSTAPIAASNGSGSIEDDIRAAFGELQGRA